MTKIIIKRKFIENWISDLPRIFIEILLPSLIK